MIRTPFWNGGSIKSKDSVCQGERYPKIWGSSGRLLPLGAQEGLIVEGRGIYLIDLLNQWARKEIDFVLQGKYNGPGFLGFSQPFLQFEGGDKEDLHWESTEGG
jgi:hypothetical protein